MYIHCILKNQELVVQAIKKFPGVTKVTHDNTFDEAMYWSDEMANKPEKPDIILCDEYAYASQYDPNTKTFNKDKVILEALKRIRFNLPEVRIIILLHIHRQKDFAFLQGLISLAIYDFHFIESQFTKQQLYYFLTSPPRTLKDVSNYVATPNLKAGAEFHSAGLAFQTEEPAKKKEKTPLKSKLFDKLAEIKENFNKPTVFKKPKSSSEPVRPAFQNPNALEQAGWYSVDSKLGLTANETTAALSPENDMPEDRAELATAEPSTSEQSQEAAKDTNDGEETPEIKESEEPPTEKEPESSIETVEEKPKEETPEISALAPPAPEPIAGVAIRAKTVAVTSLISGGGASALILALIQHLTGGSETIVAVDGDLEQRMLGTMLGVGSDLLTRCSWDKEMIPVVSGNVKLYPLDRHGKGEPSQDTLRRVISQAKQEGHLVLIDCGSFKDTWYYRSLLEAADVILWNYNDNSIPPEEARYKWGERLKILSSLKTRQRELIAFRGPVDTELIEDVFHVPVVKMLDDDNMAKSLEQLLEFIKNAPYQASRKILVAGYQKDMMPVRDDIFYDVFPDSQQASQWLKTHHYDEAYINSEIRGAALLEYDLRERGVSIQKF